MKYLIIIFIVISLLAGSAGCRKATAPAEATKEEIQSQEESAGSAEEDAVTEEEKIEEESSGDAKEEENKEEALEKEDFVPEKAEEENITEEDSSSEDIAQDSGEDGGDNSVIDDIQKRIDELAQDIRDGNVIPDDHE